MKYILNDNNEYIGIDYLGDQPNSIEKAPKPLFNNEKAIWSGSDWQYIRNEIPHIEQVELPDNLTILDVIDTAKENITLGGGYYSIPKEKDISILIPCYNKANTIERSIKSCISQTMPSYEIIILLMDEKSISLKSKLESLDDNIKCIISEQLCLGLARQKLIELCETEYFIFLDADDELENNFVETVYNEDASVIFPGKIFSDIGNININSCYLFTHCIMGQNMTFLQCKTVWNQLEGVDIDLSNGGEDTDYIFKLFCSNWRIRYTNNTHFIYNRQDSEMVNSNQFYTDIFKTIKKNLPIIRKGLVPIEKDWIYNFFNNDDNFKTIDSCCEKYYCSKMRSSWRKKYYFYKIKNLIEESRNRNCTNIWNENDYTNNCPASMKYTCFDAIILDPINVNTEEVDICIRKDITLEGDTFLEKIVNLMQNYCVFVQLNNTIQVKQDKENYELANIVITISFNYDCNRSCEYCNENGLKPCEHLDDEELYNRFDYILTKFEKMYNYNIIPQIMGGEPTLMSDYLIRKICNRLEDYPIIYLFSNHDIKNSLWENYSKVHWYNHIVDWYDKVIEIKAGQSYEIVITHKNIKYLKHFCEINNEKSIRFDEYLGNDDSLKLTQEDKQYLSNLETYYPNIDKHAYLYYNFIKTDEDRLNYNKQCKNRIKVYTASCVLMKVWPCCGATYTKDGILFDKFEDYIMPDNYCDDCNYCNMIITGNVKLNTEAI